MLSALTQITHNQFSPESFANPLKAIKKKKMVTQYFEVERANGALEGFDPYLA